MEKKTNAELRMDLEQAIRQLEGVSSPVPEVSLPSVRLDEMEYTAPGNKQLEAMAQAELADYRAAGERTLRDESERNAKALSAKRDEYIKGREGELGALDQSYRAAAKAIDNDAVKRGIARSSIASVNRAELEKEYLRRNADIAESYGKRIAELEGEIANTDGKLRSALDDFNLSYAAKLNQKLSELKAERDQKVKAVTEFNNNVRAKQAQLDESRARAESTLKKNALYIAGQASALDKLPAEKRNEIYSSVYNRMDEFLSSMSKEQAKYEIRNQALYRNHLSDYYYYMLYDKYGR